jgi:hypothetical protein
MLPGRSASIALNAIGVLTLGRAVLAQDAALPLDTLQATGITAGIAVDGALDDPGWQGVPRVETWYETQRLRPPGGVQVYGEAGYAHRPQGFVRRQRIFSWFDRQIDRSGDLLQQFFTFGTGADALRSLKKSAGGGPERRQCRAPMSRLRGTITSR